jgi:hypothetical protein
VKAALDERVKDVIRIKNAERMYTNVHRCLFRLASIGQELLLQALR